MINDLPKPVTRKEIYLYRIATSGGGGGVSPEPISITENGTYTAPTGKAYTSVTVNVSGGSDLDKWISGEMTELASNAIIVAPSVAFGNNWVTSVSLPEATDIGNSAFWGDDALLNVSIPKAKNIGDSAFTSCTALIEVDAPKAETLGDYAFTSCALEEFDGPNVTSSGSGTFSSCSMLQTINFPLLATISNNMFGYCSNLTNISLPLATRIEDGAFAFSGITEANFANVIEIGSAFNNCGNLVSANLPLITDIPAFAFSECVSLTDTDFAHVVTIGENAFTGCAELRSLNFPVLTALARTTPYPYGVSPFSRCSNLDTLILGGNEVVECNIDNVLADTKIATPGGGQIKVPATLVDAYKVHEKWGVYADNIVAIE